MLGRPRGAVLVVGLLTAGVAMPVISERAGADVPTVLLSVLTDTDSWSTTTTVDDGVLTAWSVSGSRIRLTTVTDTLLSERNGSVVNVRWNDQPVRDLGFVGSAPVQRVALGGFTVWTVDSGPCFYFNWVLHGGYAEAPVTNDHVRHQWVVLRSDGLQYKNVTTDRDIPSLVGDAGDGCFVCPRSVSMEYRLSTPDGWSTLQDTREVGC